TPSSISSSIPYSCPSHGPPLHHSFPTRRSSDLSSRNRSASSRESRVKSRVLPAGKRSVAVTAHLVFNDLFLDQRRDLLIGGRWGDRKSTRLNSSHVKISYAVFCLKKKIDHQNLK